MSVPKLMLFVNGSVTQRLGATFLNDLCASYPEEKLCRYSTVRGQVEPKVDSWSRRNVQYYPVQVSTLPILSSLADRSFRRHQEADLIDRAVQFGKENSVEAVWAVLNSTYIIRTALTVATKLDVPLHTMVWDPPDFFRISMHLGKRCYEDLYKVFGQTLQGSNSVSVIGESMSKQYATEFGISPVIIAHGYPTTESLPMKLISPRQLKIGFAGASLYAKREWRALLQALEGARWRVADRPVEIHHIGRRPLRGVPMPDYVIRHGVLSPAQTLHRMQNIDIAYLPYWFDTRYQRVATLSFPSKTAAYLAAGCRIFYHGPQYGSPTEFLNKYQVGTACHSLEPKEIVGVLNTLASDMMEPSIYLDARKRACHDLISREAMIRRFAAFLGCARADLN